MALSMIRKSQENRNLLFERVEHGMLSSRGKWRPLDVPDAAPDIPVLSVSPLGAFTFGLYQLKQAASYTRKYWMMRASTSLTSIMMLIILFVSEFSRDTYRQKNISFSLSDCKDAITA